MLIGEIDFETYSEAGFIVQGGKFVKPTGAKEPGLSAVGTRVYAEHPTADIISLAYDLREGKGERLWIPMFGPLPSDIRQYVQAGGLFEAANSNFEYWIWNLVGVRRYGFPPLDYRQLRDVFHKSRAFSYPGNLGKLTEVCGAEIQKDKAGAKLIKFFCVPHLDKWGGTYRNWPHDYPEKATAFYNYNIIDILSERSASEKCPELAPKKLETALYTQLMNIRGVHIDRDFVRGACRVVDQLLPKYDTEMAALTGGRVEKTSEVSKLIAWLGLNGVQVDQLRAEDVDDLLDTLPEGLTPVRRALEIRKLCGSAGIKKYYAIDRMTSNETGRLHDLFIYHGARTGRDAGQDAQPQNLVKKGAKLHLCGMCGQVFGTHIKLACPFCGHDQYSKKDWSVEYVDTVSPLIQAQPLAVLEHLYGDVALLLAGCIRGSFCAPEGFDLAASDYSSIEAVVTAMLAGEQWRIDVFRKQLDIYLMSASKITGVTYEEYVAYKAEQMKHHPDRQNLGKPCELGLGFGGWIGAFYNFDKSGRYTPEQVKKIIVDWRKASPAVVEMWGGQVRGFPWKPTSFELFGFEGAAINAIMSPGNYFSTNQISYYADGGRLYSVLPSGRCLTYHSARLKPSTKWDNHLQVWYDGWNTNPKAGPKGWIPMGIYGGKFAENCIGAGTLVLSENGWKPIENIGAHEKIHDGVDFVPHGGLLFKGVQACIEVDGVAMTPDHEVLTNEGWARASQNPEPYRPSIWGVNRVTPRHHRRENQKVGMPLLVWGHLRKSYRGLSKRLTGWTNFKLWVPDKSFNGPKKAYPRNGQAPGLQCLALDDGPVPATYSPSVAQLRGARYSSMPGMVRVFRKFLGRHGRVIRHWPAIRPEKQQRGIRADKLQMGNATCERSEQTKQLPHKHTKRENDFIRSLGSFRDRENNYPLPDKKRVAGREPFSTAGLYESPVCDIANCGPRHRFVVMGKGGPFIVHNCIQAVAADIMQDAVPKLEQAGYGVVLRAHDEIVTEIPKGFGSVEEIEALMGDLSDWAKGWPIRAAGGWRGKRFRKD